MMENGQWQPPGNDDKGGDDKKKTPNAGLGALFRAIFGGGGGGSRIPAWASRPPDDMQTLLRQLSANAGQMPMPGGVVGAVRPQPFRGQQQQSGQLMRSSLMDTYGQDGGEANFFSQTTRGGMAPISAIGPMGRPLQWNPFSAWQKRQRGGKDDDADKPGGQKDKDHKPGAWNRPGLDDMGGR